MKKAACMGMLCLLLGVCACARAERGDEKYNTLTAHARGMQTYIAEEPCWGEEWTRVNLNRAGYLPVYAAPFERMDDDDPGPYRGAEGRAQVSTAEYFDVLASRRNGEWLLIQYEIGQGKNRIGWVQTPPDLALSSEDAEEVQFTEAYAVALRDTAVTDDPYGSERVIGRIACAERVKCLGWVDAYYAYVQTVIDGQAAYGFVPLEDLAEPDALRIETVEAQLVGAWQFAGGAELMGYGVVFDENGRYMMCSTDDLTVFPPENLALSVGSAGEYEVMRNDHPTQEFWHEDAAYALVLRDAEGGVQRYICDYVPGDGVKPDRLMLYVGEGGGNYGRMSGSRAQALVSDLSHTKIYVMQDHTMGRIQGKMGITRGRHVRADIRLAEQGAYLLFYDGPPEPDGKCFGQAAPDEDWEGRYVFEAELPEGVTGIYILQILEDGSDGGLYSVQW